MPDRREVEIFALTNSNGLTARVTDYGAGYDHCWVLDKGEGGAKSMKRSALCLETEGFPDAPNKPAFPSCVLRPGETYNHGLIHKFSAE